MDKGNAIRVERAALKADLKARRKSARDLLIEMPEIACDVPVVEVLTWLPGVKKARARQILRGIVYSESMTLGRLSVQTREKILAKVDHYQPTPYMVMS